MTTKRRELIAKAIADRVRAGVGPKTQNECCALAAKVALSLDPRPLPWPDPYIIEMAADMALGLFGEAFVKADYGQKVAWIDMAELHIRRAITRRDRGK